MGHYEVDFLSGIPKTLPLPDHYNGRSLLPNSVFAEFLLK
jgi:hypothetical protein